MKIIAVIALFSLAHQLSATAEELPTLHFTNGDRLQGQLLRIDDSQLIWRSPALQKETAFHLDSIENISFPSPSSPPPTTDHIAHIRFHPDLRQQNENLPGDVIEGELLGIQAQTLQLKTWYAGELSLNRNMIQDMEISDVSPLLYHGPREAKEWISFPGDAWKFASHSYTLQESGALTKNFTSLPPRYCFRFTAAWKNRFNLQIVFGADSATEHNPEQCYMIALDNGTSYLQKRIAEPQNNPGMMQHGGMIGEYKRDQVFRSKEKSELKLFVDTTTGLIALYSDDTLIQQWNDLDPPFLQGPCIHLRQNSGQFHRITLSSMRLSTWDGTLPSSDKDAPLHAIENPPPTEGEQRIILRNGDAVLGKVVDIRGSKIALKTRFNEIKLPVSRIKKLALTPPEYDERLLQNGDVRAWFPDGNSITFRLLGTSADGELIGESQHFGKAHFSPKAFTRLDFNLYRQP
jgi:hypothetical protein